MMEWAERRSLWRNCPAAATLFLKKLENAGCQDSRIGSILAACKAHSVGNGSSDLPTSGVNLIF
jgi:hypothetical protein